MTNCRLPLMMCVNGRFIAFNALPFFLVHLQPEVSGFRAATRARLPQALYWMSLPDGRPTVGMLPGGLHPTHRHRGEILLKHHHLLGDRDAEADAAQEAVRRALDAERTIRRRDRERHARVRNSLRGARTAIQRLAESRATYRDLALRAEAALLRTVPRRDLGDLEGRLARALRAAGFTMPGRARRLAAHRPRKLANAVGAVRRRPNAPLVQRVRTQPDASSKSLLARTLGKGPGGRLFPASGLALPRFAQNWPLTCATHTRKRRLPRVRGASTIRTNSGPFGQTDAGICDPDMASPPCKSSGRAYRVGRSLTPAESTGAAARSDLPATSRLTQPERDRADRG